MALAGIGLPAGSSAQTLTIAQLKAGQVDLIARAPASDVPMLRRDGTLAVETAETVYVFDLEFDFREKPPLVSARDGSALPQNPLRDPRVREAIDLAIDRPALAGIAMEGLGKPASHLVTATVAGFNPALPAIGLDVAKARRRQEAGYPNGFKVAFAFTSDRLPGDRQVGTSITRMLARIGIDATAAAQPSAVFFPARSRGEDPLAIAGWGTITGASNDTLSSMVHSDEAPRKLGAYNLLGDRNERLDKLIEDASVAVDDAARNRPLAEAHAVVAADRPRLPIVTVGAAWAMRKDKVAIRPRVDEETLAMDISPAK